MAPVAFCVDIVFAFWMNTTMTNANGSSCRRSTKLYGIEVSLTLSILHVTLFFYPVPD